jgi:hypothetical protein
MHILNNSCVAELHPKRVAQPAKLLSDVIGSLAYFIQEDTCPNSEQMSRIFAQILGTYPQAHSLNHFLNKSGYFVCPQVH